MLGVKSQMVSDSLEKEWESSLKFLPAEKKVPKSAGKKKYLSDIKVSFQVVSHYAVEFICRVERSFCRLCGDLKKNNTYICFYNT